jgi:hypothetical protein
METDKLAKRTSRWNGLVRIFVHPLYEKWATHGVSRYPKYKKDALRHKEIETGLIRLLSMPEDKTPPIITFEEHWSLACFQNWLSDLPRSQPLNIPYVIDTMGCSPNPYSRHHDPRVEWDKLKATLIELGVQRILIGGISLDVAHKYGTDTLVDWTGKNPYVSRCVGIVLSHLSEDKAGEFKTELSSLIYPRDARGVYLKLTSATSNREFAYPGYDY